MKQKVCSKCGIVKDVSDFHKQLSKPSGLTSQCKQCRNANKTYAKANSEKIKAYSKAWYAANFEKRKTQGKAYYTANSEKCNAASKAWSKANPEEHKAWVKAWRDANPEKAKAATKAWRAKSPEKYKAGVKAWRKVNPEKVLEYARKHRSTLKGKLNSNMSRGISQSLRNNTKAGRHWEALVDFTVDQLKKHLEKLFKPGMTWENQGSYWEIDHKIPIAVFNFKTPEHLDFKKCWSLKNLQPLETSKNRSKGAKLAKPFQPSLAI